MATDQARVGIGRHPLWQLPTFLVGLGCVWALWQHGDRLRPTVGDRYERVLSALRPAVERTPPDVDRIQAALRKLPIADPPAAMAGQVRYLVGSAYVAMAESSTSISESAEWWSAARTNLEAAAEANLPDAERKKLSYRLARTWANTPISDPKKVINALASSVQYGDDPSEGHRLLADLYLRLTPPDEKRARDSLREFLRHATSRADSRILNQSRIRLAELLQKSNEFEEARKVLERVGPESPPELFAESRLMTARLHRIDDDWPAAVRLYEQVRDMKGATDAQHTRALQGLGESYARLNQPDKAAAAMTQAGPADGADAKINGIKLVEIKLHDPKSDREEIVTALEKSLSAVSKPSDLPAKSVPLAEVRRIAEEVVRRCVDAADFPAASRAVQAYQRVADPLAGHESAFRVYLAWADAGGSSPDQLRRHYRRAADELDAAARLKTKVVERGDLLVRSAELHQKGDDSAKAVTTLIEVVTKLSEYPEEKTGRAWFELGEIYLRSGEKQQAKLAYANAGSRQHAAANKARVRYAGLIQELDPDKGGPVAVQLLEQITSDRSSNDEPEVREQALYMLGDIHFQRKEWLKAEARLRSAIESFGTSPRSAKGRLQYGQCFWFRALQEARKIEADRSAVEKIKADRLALQQKTYKIDEQLAIEDRLDKTWRAYTDLLRSALEPIRAAETQLLADQTAEPELLRRAGFLAADCTYWLGELNEAAQRYAVLTERYKNRAEQLEALRFLYNSAIRGMESARERRETTAIENWSLKASDAYNRLKESLDRMPEAELDGSIDVRKRAYWERWLEENRPISN